MAQKTLPVEGKIHHSGLVSQCFDKGKDRLVSEISSSAGNLEENVSLVARRLLDAGTVDDVLQRTADLAVTTIDACEAAGLFMVREERVDTVGASAPIVRELDELQFISGEGPGLDVVADGGTIYATDLMDDARWPTFAPAAAKAGLRCVFAIQISNHPAAALNLYSTLPAAYGVTDRATGMIFATLAGFALSAAQERAADSARIANLHEALRTRDLIGQAQGILIERERITADQAFEVLRRASQHLNVKLREVAVDLIETGRRPDTGTDGRGR